MFMRLWNQQSSVVVWAPLLLGCALTVGCQPDPGLSGQWHAALGSTSARLAINAHEGEVVAYSCGGPDSMATHTVWFSGTLDGNTLELTSEEGSLSAELDAAGGTGTWMNGGAETESFEATAGDEASFEGLFDATDSGCRDGVIVWLNTANELQAQGVWCDQVGSLAQITPMNLSFGDLDGEMVEADNDGESHTFEVHRVVPGEP